MYRLEHKLDDIGDRMHHMLKGGKHNHSRDWMFQEHPDADKQREANPVVNSTYALPTRIEDLEEDTDNPQPPRQQHIQQLPLRSSYGGIASSSSSSSSSSSAYTQQPLHSSSPTYVVGTRSLGTVPPPMVVAPQPPPSVYVQPLRPSASTYQSPPSTQQMQPQYVYLEPQQPQPQPQYVYPSQQQQQPPNAFASSSAATTYGGGRMSLNASAPPLTTNQGGGIVLGDSFVSQAPPSQLSFSAGQVTYPPPQQQPQPSYVRPIQPQQQLHQQPSYVQPIYAAPEMGIQQQQPPRSYVHPVQQMQPQLPSQPLPQPQYVQPIQPQQPQSFSPYSMTTNTPSPLSFSSQQQQQQIQRAPAPTTHSPVGVVCRVPKPIT